MADALRDQSRAAVWDRARAGLYFRQDEEGHVIRKDADGWHYTRVGGAIWIGPFPTLARAKTEAED